LETLVESAKFSLASKLGAIECLVDGTEAGACRKLIGSLKSDMGSIFKAMEALSRRHDIVKRSGEKSLASRDRAINELKETIRRLKEEQEISILSQVKFNLNMVYIVTQWPAINFVLWMLSIGEVVNWGGCQLGRLSRIYPDVTLFNVEATIKSGGTVTEK